MSSKGGSILAEVFQASGLFGWLLIAIGIVLVILPIIAKLIPSVDDLGRVPWIILFVYRRENFVFITSPILLIISVISFVWLLIRS